MDMLTRGWHHYPWGTTLLQLLQIGHVCCARPVLYSDKNENEHALRALFFAAYRETISRLEDAMAGPGQGLDRQDPLQRWRLTLEGNQQEGGQKNLR